MEDGGSEKSGTPPVLEDVGARGAFRATLTLVVLCALSSCAIVGGGSRGEEVIGPVASAVEAPPLAPVPAPTPAWSVRLTRARALLATGSFTEAAAEFEAALRLGAEGEPRTEAHWGLALIHLSPASPLRDRGIALTHLDIVEHETEDGLVQAQAVWARATLEQVAQLNGQIQERDELLRQLNEALEMLRQIDLNRRPSGGAPPGASPGGDSP
jgi:hypothetical protein